MQLKNVVISVNDIKKMIVEINNYYRFKTKQFNEAEIIIREDEIRREEHNKIVWSNLEPAVTYTPFKPRPVENKKISSVFDIDITYKNGQTKQNCSFDEAIKAFDNANEIAKFSIGLYLSYYKRYDEAVLISSSDTVNEQLDIYLTEEGYATYSIAEKNTDEKFAEFKDKIVKIFDNLPKRYDKTVSSRVMIKFIIGFMYSSIFSLLIIGGLGLYMILTNASISIFSFWPLVLYLIISIFVALFIPLPKINRLYMGLIPRKKYYYIEKTRNSGTVDDELSYKDEAEIQIGQFYMLTGAREKILKIYKRSKIISLISLIVGLAATIGIWFLL